MQGRWPSQALLFPSSEGSVCPAVNLSLQFCSKAIRLMCIHQALVSNAEEVKVSESCPTLCDPMDRTVHGIFQARILEWVAVPFSRGFSQPRIKPRSPALQVDSLPAEPPGKPRNTGVGSLSLLQWIFPTQELNQGLLHCRWILIDAI